ncbi:MFS transporter [Streptomyces sudanensis]|uniref:MFS transporter n=1 Tax=Streptomyces sudanensis TaxID=436397 RepID=UPI0020CFD8B4|nr:MFS transporter [Streptomyces sudanensis]MCP9987959.1 MFS transporter [Streptomyces sudanensis]
MSEGIYDIAFANLALDLSGLVSTVGLVYCVGYGVEVVASIAAGPLLDRGNPRTVLVVSYLLKIGVFVLIGLGSTFLSSHLWAIVAAAAVVDLVHHVGEMALFVLLPRILDPTTLVRVQGVAGTVRSAAELLSPVVAGLVIVLYPGSRALLVAAGLHILALAVFAVLVTVVAKRPRPVQQDALSGSGGEEPGDSRASAEPDRPSVPLPNRRAVARTIMASPAWRWFTVLNGVTVLALSTVILSLLPLMRETLDMSAARAGTFLAFSTFGAIIGGLVVAKAGPEGIAGSLRWAPALAGAGALTAAFLGGNQWILGIGLILFGLGFTVYLRSAGLVVQLRAPSAILGTWHGLLDAVVRIVSAAAILAAGFLFDRFGGTAVYAVIGALLLLTSVFWSGFAKEHQHSLEATPLHPPVQPNPLPRTAGSDDRPKGRGVSMGHGSDSRGNRPMSPSSWRGCPLSDRWSRPRAPRSRSPGRTKTARHPPVRGDGCTGADR